MDLFLARIEFVVILMASRMLWLTKCTNDCSFYTFNYKMKTWQESRSHCQANGGDLLSMETEKEYQFINKTLQSRNEGNTEWYIGLKRRTGVWKWISGPAMTIGKWQPNQPSYDGHCVIMAKHWPPGYHGLFNDLKCYLYKMFICENKMAISNHTQGVLKYCSSETVTTRPTITTTGATSMKTTISNEMTSLSMSNNHAPATYTFKSYHTESTSTDMSVQVSPNPKPLKTSSPVNASKRFPTMLVAIVLGVLLAVGICVFFVVFWWMKKKSGRSKSKKKPWQSYAVSTPMAQNESYLTNQRNNIIGLTTTEDIQLTEPDSVLYAEIADDMLPPHSPTNSSSSHSEVEYANSPSADSPSGYANLIQNPVYQNQMPYQPLNKYPEEMDEDEIAI